MKPSVVTYVTLVETHGYQRALAYKAMPIFPTYKVYDI